VNRRAFIALLGGAVARWRGRVAALGCTQPDGGCKGEIKDDVSFVRRSNRYSRHSTRACDGGAQRSCIRWRKLDASYTISFARIRVGDITATGLFEKSEYAISARAHAGGIMKQLNLVDGEASFSTHGIIKDGYPGRTVADPKAQ
jgi:hypothetical protein